MLKLCLFVLLLGNMATGIVRAVPASKGEKPPIPPDLYYEFKPIPDDENAIINWRRAAEVQVPLSSKEREIIRYCWTPGAPEPSPEDLAELKHWFQQNEDALRLLEASLQKPGVQWPERNPQNVHPELRAIQQQIRARMFEADQWAEQNKFDEAAKSLKESLKLTEVGIESDDTAMIQYLILGSERTLVQGAILRLAARREIPVPLMENLLKSLPDIDSETNTYAHILRVDFTMYDYSSHDIDVKQMADAWAKISETNIVMMLYPEELRRPFKVLIDPSLVSKHPKPLDEVAMIEDDARHYRIYRTNSYSAWTNHNDSVEKEKVEAQKKLIEDIQPLMESVTNEPLPLSREATQTALGAYVKIENPVGRILTQMDLAESDVWVFRHRTEREAARTILALLIFERKKGMLPAKLSDLVDAKILDSVPYDPFANAPISYSRDRRIVWSVGEDGVNDNGDGDDEAVWAGDDAVWKIPHLN